MPDRARSRRFRHRPRSASPLTNPGSHANDPRAGPGSACYAFQERHEGPNLQDRHHPGEDGFFVADCPSIPGCVSQGKTKRLALKNIKEAIELALECTRRTISLSRGT